MIHEITMTEAKAQMNNDKSLFIGASSDGRKVLKRSRGHWRLGDVWIAIIID